MLSLSGSGGPGRPGVVVAPVHGAGGGVQGVEGVTAAEDHKGRASRPPGWNQAEEVTRPPSEVASRGCWPGYGVMAFWRLSLNFQRSGAGPQIQCVEVVVPRARHRRCRRRPSGVAVTASPVGKNQAWRRVRWRKSGSASCGRGTCAGRRGRKWASPTGRARPARPRRCRAAGARAGRRRLRRSASAASSTARANPRGDRAARRGPRRAAPSTSA